MGTLEIPRCSWCAAEITLRSPGRPGRPRRFCSDRCRKAAYRARRRRDLEPALAFVAELPELPPEGSPDELIAQTVLQTRGAAATFARLAPVARRDFAWRCEHAAVEIKRTIDDYFPGV